MQNVFKMKKIKEVLFTLFSPFYWLQNFDYSFVWDSKLNSLMNEFEFEIMSEFTAKLGDTTIWIGNHPYASFTPYGKGGIERGRLCVRPSRLTIFRAMKKLKLDYKNQAEQKINNN